jgi:hypothetical protein
VQVQHIYSDDVSRLTGKYETDVATPKFLMCHADFTFLGSTWASKKVSCGTIWTTHGSKAITW